MVELQRPVFVNHCAANKKMYVLLLCCPMRKEMSQKAKRHKPPPTMVNLLEPFHIFAEHTYLPAMKLSRWFFGGLIVVSVISRLQYRTVNVAGFLPI